VSNHEDDADEANAFMATARSLSLGIELSLIDQIQIEVTSAGLAQTNGKFEQAVADANKGLELLSGVDEGDLDFPNMKISLLQIILSSHFASEAYEEAAALSKTIHALEEKRLGPEHSQLVGSFINMATIDYKLNKFEEALALLQRAKKLMVVPDINKSDLGQALSTEALIQNRLGNLPEAVALYEQTIEVFKELYGDDHANIWRTKANLANTLMALQRWDEVLVIQEGFAAWAGERYGKDSPTAFNARLNLGMTMVQSHYEDGEVLPGQAVLNELERDLPKSHPTLVPVKNMQGNAFLVLKQYAQAAQAYEQSLALEEASKRPEAGFRATTGTALADALWLAGKKQKALRVGRRVLQEYDSLATPMPTERASHAKWLEEKERAMKP